MNALETFVKRIYTLLYCECSPDAVLNFVRTTGQIIIASGVAQRTRSRAGVLFYFLISITTDKAWVIFAVEI